MKKHWIRWILLAAVLTFALAGTVSAESNGTYDYTVNGNTCTINRYNGGLSSVSIPEKLEEYTVTAIGEYAFSKNDKLTSVTIPKTVTTIGKGAFNECAKLTTVKIATGGLTTVGEQAFWSSGLTTIALPYGVTEIGLRAFAQCKALKTVTLPDTLTAIGQRAFFSSGLTSVIVPGKVTTVGNGAFESCTALKTVTLSGGMTTIAESMFSGCTTLSSIVIPSSVTSIQKNAFNATGLTSLLVPTGVTSIGESAFMGCTKLRSLCIPGGVSALGTNALSGCTLLTAVHYSGAENGLTGVPDGKEIHLAGSTVQSVSESSCSTAGTEKETVFCNKEGCKESLPAVTRPLPKLDHQIINLPEEPATCTTPGKTAGAKCKVCNTYTIEPTVIPKGEHNMVAVTNGEETIIEEATCSKEGTKSIVTEKCDRVGCNYVTTKTEPIEKLSHEAADEKNEAVTKEPGCTEDGTKDIITVCKNCGAEMERETDVPIPAAHKWKEPEFVTTKEPTCGNKGEAEEQKLCSVCGTKDDTFTGQKKELDALTHEIDLKSPDYKEEIKEPTCTAEGTKTVTGTCKHTTKDADGKEVTHTATTTETLKALGHDYKSETEPEIITAASCETSGVQLVGAQTCARCGDTKSGERQEIPPLGHKYGDPVLDSANEKAPTCKDDGSVPFTNTCERCAKTDAGTLVIPATGNHKWSEWNIIQEATATEQGLKEHTCADCQTVESEKIPVLGTLPDDSDAEPVLYDIKLVQGSFGRVSASASSAAARTQVSVYTSAYSGYELNTLQVTNTAGKTVPLTNSGSGRFTFNMPESQVEVKATFSLIPSTTDNTYNGGATNGSSSNTPTVTPPSTSPTPVQSVPRIGAYNQLFTDIPTTHWAAGEIAWANQRGYMNGSNGRFNPNGTITFQQLWMVMARLTGNYPANMADARRWATENGFAEANNPNVAVTRHQLVTSLHRCALLMGSTNRLSSSLAPYRDSQTVPSGSRVSMSWAVANGIISGTAEGRLNPNETITRAQFAVILYRFSQRI